MSLTHHPSHLQDTLRWTNHHPYPIMDSSPQTTLLSTRINHHQQPKQPMFEKPLTPSDVGKLNRLVIPKQYAERYFPLSSVDQHKELLLCFEDEAGKQWRFRYSYWNSSQSYVLTKGWSRYVKEKKLDAGDVVLFERHRFDGDRLFIGWRRRHSGGAQDRYSAAHHGHRLNPASLPYPCQRQHDQHGSIHAGGLYDNVENNQRYVVASGNPRRVRLFGVNLECPDEYEPSVQDGSSQGGQSHTRYSSGSNNVTHNMNINFSQLRYHQHEE